MPARMNPMVDDHSSLSILPPAQGWSFTVGQAPDDHKCVYPRLCPSQLPLIHRFPDAVPGFPGAVTDGCTLLGVCLHTAWKEEHMITGCYFLPETAVSSPCDARRKSMATSSRKYP